MSQSKKWVPYLKIDRRALMDALDSVKKNYKSAELVTLEMAERALRSPSDVEAIAALKIKGQKEDPFIEGMHVRKPEEFVALLVMHYEDARKGDVVKAEEKDVMSLAVCITTAELRQIQADMNTLGVKDRDEYLRSCIMLMSKAILVGGRENQVVLRGAKKELPTALVGKEGGCL